MSSSPHRTSTHAQLIHLSILFLSLVNFIHPLFCNRHTHFYLKKNSHQSLKILFLVFITGYCVCFLLFVIYFLFFFWPYLFFLTKLDHGADPPAFSQFVRHQQQLWPLGCSTAPITTTLPTDSIIWTIFSIWNNQQSIIHYYWQFFQQHSFYNL